MYAFLPDIISHTLIPPPLQIISCLGESRHVFRLFFFLASLDWALSADTHHRPVSSLVWFYAWCHSLITLSHKTLSWRCEDEEHFFFDRTPTPLQQVNQAPVARGVASATPQWFRDSSEKKVHPKVPLSQPNLEGWDEPKTFQKEKAGVQQADIL